MPAQPPTSTGMKPSDWVNVALALAAAIGAASNIVFLWRHHPDALVAVTFVALMFAGIPLHAWWTRDD